MKSGKVSSFSQAVQPSAGAATALEKRLAVAVLRILGDPRISVTLWDGTVIPPGTGSARVGFTVRDRKWFWRLLWRPELSFGDGYSAGRIDLDGDLTELVERVREVRPPYLSRSPLARLLLGGLTRRRKTATVRRARDNIHHHYDIGNDFYRLWLDPEMVYTCAYYPAPALSLAQAQLAKMEHVCRKLRLRPGQQVVEAGCGWGALARYMARHYGVKVKAYNVSQQQLRYARERARREGLADRIEYLEDDYRNITGDYDAFVSIGMLEHVGRGNFRALSRVIDRVLKPEGMGLLHSIGQNEPEPMTPWIAARIFPGAYTPTLQEMVGLLEPHDFAVLDVENLRRHYARTCAHWLANFEACAEQVRAMFDEPFVRAWRLYLASSAASFNVGSLQLYQVVFTRRTNNALPWSRADLYREAVAQ
ncbi:MAG TPA: class I SAM-dependent methyltransferase [Gammaproteobacteria bacterium]|nr:class I SAM-dependent methyltransferase [Gammaproteobacteria bacterium]